VDDSVVAEGVVAGTGFDDYLWVVVVAYVVGRPLDRCCTVLAFDGRDVAETRLVGGVPHGDADADAAFCQLLADEVDVRNLFLVSDGIAQVRGLVKRWCLLRGDGCPALVGRAGWTRKAA
jgi:hypothetical protein